MEELFECGECGDVFSTEDTLKKHAGLEHGNSKVEIKDGRKTGSFLKKAFRKLTGRS